MMKFLAMLAILLAHQAHAAMIEGVWNLTEFTLKDPAGRESQWCEGAFGSIAYYKGQMSVAINCSSKPEKLLFYSGPYRIDSGSVIHEVKNFSDPSLKQIFSRKIAMPSDNKLDLIGELPDGSKAIVSWKRRECIKRTGKKLPGVYQLISSANDFEGESNVPFCNGVFGSIMFTPGGYVSVSLNCLPKKDVLRNEPADIFARRYFYSGKYEIDGDDVINLPENGTEVSHIGQPQVRSMTLKNGILTLKGTNGSTFVAVWKKVNQ